MPDPISPRRHFLIVAAIWAVLSTIGIVLVAGMQIMPVIASRQAEIENTAFVLMSAASVPVLLLVVVPMAYAAVRFRARPGQSDGDGPPVHGHRAFERAWVALSFLAVAGLALYGSIGILEIRGSEPAVLEVRAIASQWRWQFEYPGTDVKAKELTLPVGQRIHIVITAKDVIHSFSVPAFGVKQDAVPGRETYFNVTPTFTGDYGAQCAELCGVGHTLMVVKVHVLEAAAFDAWLAEEARKPAAP